MSIACALFGCRESLVYLSVCVPVFLKLCECAASVASNPTVVSWRFVSRFVLELVAYLRTFVSGTGALHGVMLVHTAWMISLVRMTTRVL